ncbi:hypothetical protein [Poseidonibacter ostreae]|jgi:hypothetical protein|uniref:Uncharacterized protein n=1 Tax=Poseidonibacter ostreae TaxID=2654171 RepID=A0A6L4WSP1_9BACT|nr:hypothetical protein [Poseidonibacter ostreae]KAB7886269.1 hypothetical protein GA417_05955 [Poseidonibacter ostreae]KAB7888900.1 hypothetical protein GBG19_07620 [Poseidonibacter ostreae]KAB7890067.1 hypothetical protein GBG18_09935 [Poseidonibacter ostreae]MAC84909.1 hypothetical protein [Arcobacter sp.]|tara:strand:+ start:3966 stop:4448 length:483 start_codon:yes stop_codon:yes gene_type:complete
MRFNDLDLNAKKELNIKINEYANSIGGINFFLQMIEDVRAEKPNALLNKTAIFHYTKGKITWSKSIYKDTLTQLFNAMRKEDKDGDILNGLNPKVYKETMNMMRALKPVSISIRNEDNSSGFAVDILDASEVKKTKVDLMFKIIFFYNIEFAKDALTFKA